MSFENGENAFFYLKSTLNNIILHINIRRPIKFKFIKQCKHLNSIAIAIYIFTRANDY
jgi:hypothetical protein